MIRILTVIGARPQFIKASVVSKAIIEHEKLEEIIVHTGQHFDPNMSDIFFNDLKIPKPKYNLQIDSGSHGQMTGRMIEKVEEILLSEKPDCVMVYGDTNSTMAGALAASKIHIPVIHVEAGLRSFNMQMPEEINRIVTDRLSRILFTSTQAAEDNLTKEGFNEFENIDSYLVGDVMKDAALFFERGAFKPVELSNEIDDFFLCTFHRAENTDDPKVLENIVNALNDIHKNIMPVVLPIHPRTKNAIEKHGLRIEINVISPVSYLEMIWLLKNSKAALTDSGGLQKEAYFFNKPCITIREQTEWVELIEAGASVLTGSDPQKIIAAAKNIETMNFDNSKLYGDGRTSQKIVEIIATLK